MLTWQKVSIEICDVWWTTAANFRVCFVHWHWGECSLPCAFVLGIHPKLSLAFAFTIGIHLKATTRLISNFHIKNVSLPQTIMFNHHKFMVYSVDPPQPEVCHSRYAMESS